MKRTIDSDGPPVDEVQRLLELLASLGRRRSLRDPIAAAVEEMQLTPPQIHTLLWLGRDGALTMGELARRLGITEKTVTGVVDRLEREGHLHRARDAEDRRVVRCHLTPRGQAAFTRMDRHLREGLQRLLALLDAQDRRALLRILEHLEARAADAAEEDA